MFRTEVSKLMRRMLVLAVLITGLALASSGLVQRNANAAICCSQCFVNFDNCLNNCGSNQTCIDGCNATLERCHRFCNSGC
jgi:hypothetical protein